MFYNIIINNIIRKSKHQHVSMRLTTLCYIFLYDWYEPRMVRIFANRLLFFFYWCHVQGTRDVYGGNSSLGCSVNYGVNGAEFHAKGNGSCGTYFQLSLEECQRAAQYNKDNAIDSNKGNVITENLKYFPFGCYRWYWGNQYYFNFENESNISCSNVMACICKPNSTCRPSLPGTISQGGENATCERSCTCSKMDLGNGVCNLNCNTSICKYDGSDCLSEKNEPKENNTTKKIYNEYFDGDDGVGDSTLGLVLTWLFFIFCCCVGPALCIRRMCSCATGKGVMEQSARTGNRNVQVAMVSSNQTLLPIGARQGSFTFVVNNSMRPGDTVKFNNVNGIVGLELSVIIPAGALPGAQIVVPYCVQNSTQSINAMELIENPLRSPQLERKHHKVHRIETGGIALNAKQPPEKPESEDKTKSVDNSDDHSSVDKPEKISPFMLLFRKINDPDHPYAWDFM